MAIDYYSALSPASQHYLTKKHGYDLGNLFKVYGDEKGMAAINDTLTKKGGQAITDISQANSALAPLIEKRNKKGIGGIFGLALPILGSLFAPGLGTALGSALGIGSAAGGAIAGAGIGGLTSKLTGGDFLKGALLGGATGGLQGATAGKVLAQSGPLKGSLVTPGVSSTIASSGPAAGSMVSPTIGSGVGTSIESFNPDLLDKATSLGSRALSGVNDVVSGVSSKIEDALGIGGGAAANTADAGGEMFGLTGGGSTAKSGGSLLTKALSGYMDYNQQDDIEEKLKQGQQDALGAIDPYVQSGYAANKKLMDALTGGFNPGDLESDPGYQFRLAEGERALNRKLNASGMRESGAALKAAQEYGQGLAADEYNDAFKRWMQENGLLSDTAGRGMSAAGAAGDIYGNLGNIRAEAKAGKSNTLNELLKNILMGSSLSFA